MSYFFSIETREVLKTVEPGQKSWPVAVVQINLIELGFDLVVNGDYDRTMRSAVVAFQGDHDLPAEGLVGPRTMRSMGLTLMWPVQAVYRTPPGLGRGMFEGESGYDLACVSPPNHNRTRDLGGWQESVEESIIASGDLAYYFNARLQAHAALAKVRKKHDQYLSWGCAHWIAWRLAVLFHNRQTDADAVARASAGKNAINWTVLSSTPGWYETGGVSYSKREWCVKYVTDKCKYMAAPA